MSHIYKLFVSTDEDFDTFKHAAAAVFSTNIVKPENWRAREYFVVNFEGGIYGCTLDTARQDSYSDFTDKHYQYRIDMNAPRDRDGEKEKPTPDVQYVFDKLKETNKYGLMLVWDAEKLWEVFEPSQS